ncbi:Peptidoglycan/LPS O-acetylase OafA/YrhL, contains acyltransferase and SGNH-hydrolase domains [Pustulibacterium marinum]|uniref:Peptidoglycan/LPS O-acetylase OafA/YrhL, contains acyltransferase and SGNH-hydrolase domains n=1 Tax=Pustulibacterium marinum TaxID=1224947 RepID=A0A1I7H7M4_9FLAO|nr:acyltransferase [Pustulibacterium marinum]SFU56708.1 Peptidoglycan/LPS O-acetylase OafA/YrhL, contains acyltransferase and SGNH-hydrolase domains [Pustulibacterium marinum]
MNSQTTIFKDTKQHFEILDGLRGVAAIIVVLFHILEIFSNGDHTKQLLNHGYLAVDFFFMLSGFVIAHAYDDRWNSMNLKSFFQRRIIRLQPMIISGMTLGALLFYFSDAANLFPIVHNTPVWKVILIMILGWFLIPVPLSMDIRGWQEMYPLNGPAWSLFFEYIANILYALVLRKLNNKVLTVLTLIAGGLLIHLAFTSSSGDIIGGWSLSVEQLHIGFARLLFPFLAGILLCRTGLKKTISGNFFVCAFLLIAVLVFPRLGGHSDLWMNSLYDIIAIVIVFPIILLLGANSTHKPTTTLKLSKFLGDLSYPLYITHFPIVYVFYAWVINHNITLENAWPTAIAVLLISIITAYVALQYFDIPIRKWLTKKILHSKTK